MDVYAKALDSWHILTLQAFLDGLLKLRSNRMSPRRLLYNFNQGIGAALVLITLREPRVILC